MRFDVVHLHERFLICLGSGPDIFQNHSLTFTSKNMICKNDSWNRRLKETPNCAQLSTLTVSDIIRMQNEGQPFGPSQNI